MNKVLELKYKLKELYDNTDIKDKDELVKLDEDKLLSYVTNLKNKFEFEKYNALMYFKPDSWFMKVADKMHDIKVCGVIAGNRLGKSYQSTWLHACHLTGLYPEDYKGYKYTTGIDTWVLTGTAEQYTQAGGLQEYLFGPIDDIGSGWIPKDHIIKTTSGIGVKNFIKKAVIKHIADDGTESESTIEFKSYSQGQGMMMGASISFALIDEEAPMDVFTQVITRTATPKTGKETGRILVSLTPEKGLTELVNSFWEGHYAKGLVRGTIDDVIATGRLTDADRDALKEMYPKYQWDMRLYGEPQLGQGVIYPFDHDLVTYNPEVDKIQNEWRMIAGLDLGVNDPCSVSIIAKDVTTQRVYVVEEFYKEGVHPPEVAAWIKRNYPGIPVVLPHDGFNNSHNSSSTSFDLYEKEGLNLVYERFSNPPRPGEYGKKNNHIEPGLSVIREKMRTGEFKIGIGCTNTLRELRTYAYGSNGKPLPIQSDHAMDSMRYGSQMIDRFGIEARQAMMGVTNNGFNSDYSDYALTF